MTTNTEKIDPAAALRVELTEVLYALRIWHGVPSFVVRRTHPGWQSYATRKGPSQQGESDAIWGTVMVLFRDEVHMAARTPNTQLSVLGM
jgi:hypothetical protein